jgi:hypothetical protein
MDADASPAVPTSPPSSPPPDRPLPDLPNNGSHHHSLPGISVNPENPQTGEVEPLNVTSIVASPYHGPRNLRSLWLDLDFKLRMQQRLRTAIWWEEQLKKFRDASIAYSDPTTLAALEAPAPLPHRQFSQAIKVAYRAMRRGAFQLLGRSFLSARTPLSEDAQPLIPRALSPPVAYSILGRLFPTPALSRAEALESLGADPDGNPNFPLYGELRDNKVYIPFQIHLTGCVTQGWSTDTQKFNILYEEPVTHAAILHTHAFDLLEPISNKAANRMAFVISIEDNEDSEASEDNEDSEANEDNEDSDECEFDTAPAFELNSLKDPEPTLATHPMGSRLLDLELGPDVPVQCVENKSFMQAGSALLRRAATVMSRFTRSASNDASKPASELFTLPVGPVTEIIKHEVWYNPPPASESTFHRATNLLHEQVKVVEQDAATILTGEKA